MLHATPLIEAAPIAHTLNVRSVYFKLDNLQPTGSFKIRGMSHLVRHTKQHHPNLTTIVSSSGGNAGMAAAFAAKLNNLACRVYVPSTTSLLVQGRLRDLGAEVVVAGNVWNEANTAAEQHVREVNAANGEGTARLVHPFDDPILWEGHASLAKEIDEEVKAREGGRAPSVVVCSVGGGGLLAGVATGFKQLDDSERPILVGVETTGAGSWHAAVTEGNGDRPVRIPAITSIAKSLGSLEVAQGLLDLRKEYGEKKVVSALVSDRQALDAVVKFADDHRMLVEPACGAALALAYAEPAALNAALPKGLGPEDIVVIVVCGGSAVTLDFIKDWDEHLKKDGQ
ncbi:hypothetical protein HDU96_004678 [Phlyctochytrium bullatum]|nr:hypothetical protein HDU96_004678 [Phlyctochytrium bullatum]